jgi:thiamine kinase-like enzyme
VLDATFFTQASVRHRYFRTNNTTNTIFHFGRTCLGVVPNTVRVCSNTMINERIRIRNDSSNNVNSNGDGNSDSNDGRHVVQQSQGTITITASRSTSGNLSSSTSINTGSSDDGRQTSAATTAATATNITSLVLGVDQPQQFLNQTIPQEHPNDVNATTTTTTVAAAAVSMTAHVDLPVTSTVTSATSTSSASASASTSDTASRIRSRNDSHATTTCSTSDPYVTAETYRKCVTQSLHQQHQQQHQQQSIEMISNSDTSYTGDNDSHRSNINSMKNTIDDDRTTPFHVYYVNDRPYLPKWRVEIVAEDDDTKSAYSQRNSKNTNSNPDDADPYSAVKAVAAAIMSLQPQPTNAMDPKITTLYCKNHNDTTNATSTRYLSVERVMGGVTNTLYKVSGFVQLQQQQQHAARIEHVTNTDNPSTTSIMEDSVLVRIFGAEGLIDRDDETSVFAALSQCQLAPFYYGRFQNGRVEGYRDGMRPLHYTELRTGPLVIRTGIAINLARLHYGFRIVPTVGIERRKPTLWKQLSDWFEQALAVTFQSDSDTQVVTYLDLPTIRSELIWLQDKVETVMDWTTDPIVFCHNDLLAANILYNDTTETIQLIDFEYGGINYRAFDIANHFNEYAGGPPTEIHPNYDLLPTPLQQRYFIRTYLETALAVLATTSGASSSFSSASTVTLGVPTINGSTNNTLMRENEGGVARSKGTTDTNKCNDVDDDQIDTMMKEVKLFCIINHLYWGLWGINQASIEGCVAYDYLTYGANRIRQYWYERNKI